MLLSRTGRSVALLKLCDCGCGVDREVEEKRMQEEGGRSRGKCSRREAFCALRCDARMIAKLRTRSSRRCSLEDCFCANGRKDARRLEVEA